METEETQKAFEKIDKILFELDSYETEVVLTKVLFKLIDIK